MKLHRSKIYLTLILLIGFLCAGYAQKKEVSEITVQGNKRTKTNQILRLMNTKKGTALDSIVLARDILMIKRLQSIADARFLVNRKEENYNVIIEVEENYTLIPSANIYTTNDDEFAFRLGLYEFNLFGKNISIGGFYQNDIYSSYGINFRAPFLFSKKFGLALNHQSLNTQEPVFFDSGTEQYKYSNTSYEIAGLYQFDFHNKIELGINYFNEAYKNKDENPNINSPQNFDVNKLLYKLVYEYNNLDFHFQYISGFKNTLNFQYVVSTDDILPDFLIGWNDLSYFARVGKKGNWASRLRVGLASNDESPFAPFAVDNNLNVRGVGNVIDRGTGVIVLNTEYRHTLYEKKWFILQSNVFVDGGSWRNPGGDLGDFSNSQNFRLYPGVGLRFIHKKIFNATFRIDYGYGVTKNATNGFVFGIGQYF